MERNRGGRPRHPDVLTPAEWRVLEALREGGTNAEIGARLGISADAVKYHISNMLGKLELRDRRALAAWRPEERRGRLPAWFAAPAAIGAIARPVAWVGIGTVAAAGVAAAVVATVVAVAVLLVVVGGDGEPPSVVRAPLPTPEATSTPARTPSPTPTPASRATPAATPTPTVTPSPSPTPQPTLTPEPGGPAMRYDHFDPAGEASTPGSYTFLMPDGDGMRAVETYEELRTESMVLRLHVVDADGVSHEAFYNSVAAGDVVEWRYGDDCWVRHMITSPLPNSIAVARDFDVRWLAYAGTGCAGMLDNSAEVRARWDPPVIASRAAGSNPVTLITSPIRYGPYLLIPTDWDGPLEEHAEVALPAVAGAAVEGDHPLPEWPSFEVEEVRRHPLWREPAVPAGWMLTGAQARDSEELLAGWEDDEHAVLVTIARHVNRPSYVATPGGPEANVWEARTIAGRPAVLWYDPTGTLGLGSSVEIYDDSQGIEYGVHAYTSVEIDIVIAMARSLLPHAAEPSDR
ncbi:MAG: helix-turn-helix transcriptional regulator [Chloroflexi bacterium]|nr:helix-turn-helix transcriptional regulator [Chloroflexota bacterium]